MIIRPVSLYVNRFVANWTTYPSWRPTPFVTGIVTLL